MSKFSEKLRSGIAPSEEDWSDHLLWIHSASPGGSGRFYGRHRVREGRTSYEHLADTIEASKTGASRADALTVVDLACGAGHLIEFLLPKVGPSGKVIGVDFSEAELAIARKWHEGDGRVSLHCAKASALPLADESADAILCHLGLMLMLPIEPVIQEIARVLKSGGVFSAVIASTQLVQSGLHGEILELVSQMARARYPVLKEVRMGEPRVFSEDGLSQIFRRDLGFQTISALKDVKVRYRMNIDQLWAMIGNVYLLSWMPDTEREEIGRAVKRFVSSKEARSDGFYDIEIVYKEFSVLKS